MSPDDYRQLDGIGLGSLIARGEVSAREAAEAAVNTINLTNPRFNAVISERFEAAIAGAAAHGQSPLAGVPFLLKDVNLYSADLPTRFASRFFADAPAKPDSDMVARWRKAGLTILGKTNTPEFAAEFVTEPASHGPTLNPWDVARTVGGSSGGAAVAVLAGMVPLAHATDLGGSIRIPSACCGTFGFKPTSGLNPVTPHFQAIASGLNSDHVITRSVRDSAASLDITANHGPGGSSTWLAASTDHPGRLRIGIIRDDSSGRLAGPAALSGVEQVADILRSDGHLMEDLAFPTDMAVDAWFDWLWVVDILHLVDEETRRKGRGPADGELEPLTTALMERIRSGSAGSLDDALARKRDYAARFAANTRDFDLLLIPSLAHEPVALGSLSYRAFNDIDAWNKAGYDFSPFSLFANLTGQPAAIIPVGLNATSGLPITAQIAAPVAQDATVLRIASALEKALAWSDLYRKCPV